MVVKEMDTKPSETDEENSQHHRYPSVQWKGKQDSKVQKKRSYSTEDNSADEISKNNAQNKKLQMHKHQHKRPTSDKTVIEEASNSRVNIVDRPTSESFQVSRAGNDDFESTIVVQPCKEQEDRFFANTIGVFRLLTNLLIGQSRIKK